MRRTPRPVVLLALLVGCMIASGLWLLHGTQVHDCRQIELLKARIRTVVSQGQGTLGQPGSAGYAYYRDHPAELRRALEAMRTTLRIFAVERC